MADKYISGIFYQVRFRNITEGTRIRFYLGQKSPNGTDYVYATSSSNLSGNPYIDIVAGPNITEYNLEINNAEEEAKAFSNVQDADDYYGIIYGRIYGCFRITSNSAVNITYETKKEQVSKKPDFTIIKTTVKDIGCAQTLENKEETGNTRPIIRNGKFQTFAPDFIKGKTLVKFYTLRFEANLLTPSDAETPAAQRQGFNNTRLNDTQDNKNYYTNDYKETAVNAGPFGDYTIMMNGEYIDLLNARYYEVHDLSGITSLAIGAAITATWSCRIK